MKSKIAVSLLVLALILLVVFAVAFIVAAGLIFGVLAVAFVMGLAVAGAIVSLFRGGNERWTAVVLLLVAFVGGLLLGVLV